MGIYQEKISFDGKQWYLLEWDGIEFRKMDILFELKNYSTLEELMNTISEKYPDCKAVATPIEAPKPVVKRKKNEITNSRRSLEYYKRKYKK